MVQTGITLVSSP